MDVQRFFDQTVDVVGTFVPSLLGALAILLVGWIVAIAVAMIVRGLLRRTTIDNRLAQLVTGRDTFANMSIERIVARTAFYVVMLFVLIAFFQALGLTIVTDPLNAFLLQLTEFAPRLLGALLLLGVALLVATVVRTVVTRGLRAVSLDSRLGEATGTTDSSGRFGHVMFWLVLLLFLPGILGTLSLEGMLEPVREMTNRVLSFVPNLFAALIIGGVGWLAASLLARIVVNLLRSAGADDFGGRIGLGPVLGQAGLSGASGTLIRTLVLVPVGIAALNALQLDAVTAPASDMLSRLLNAVPVMFAAALILVVAFIVGKLVSSLVANALAAVGFDRLPAVLGLTHAPAADERRPSAAVGTLTLVAIMFFAAMESAQMLGFGMFATLISTSLLIAGRVALAVVAFALGLYLANLAARSVASSRADHAVLLSTLARGGILLFSGSIALRMTGLANDVVDLAFGLTFGALAVAAALAFGLGSRETAGRFVEDWTKQFQRRQH